MIALATDEMSTLGLIERHEVVDGAVVRMPKAYPVYDHAYQSSVHTLREYLTGFSNLYVVGRNGQHRYNNQDHSMLAGMCAARNIAGASLDVWGGT